MGCDIHMYREKRVDGRWLTADEWESYDYGHGDAGLRVNFHKRVFTGRDYELFGILSKGVRTEQPYSFLERGMPRDASPEVLAECDRWNGDGHSHSYLYLHEVEDLKNWLSERTIPIEGVKDPEELKLLEASIATGTPDWSLIFPFCKWTSRNDAVPFKFDVPAIFWIGESLDKIISGFDGVDGDLHRVVFWFDN